MSGKTLRVTIHQTRNTSHFSFQPDAGHAHRGPIILNFQNLIATVPDQKKNECDQKPQRDYFPPCHDDLSSVRSSSSLLYILDIAGIRPGRKRGK